MQHQIFIAAQTNDTPMMYQLLQQIQVMQQQISGLMLTNKQLSHHGGNILSTNQGGQNKDLNQKTGLPWKHYCWSCGCCPHWSKNCSLKNKVHKDEASFKNRMGGSNENCLRNEWRVVPYKNLLYNNNIINSNYVYLLPLFTVVSKFKAQQQILKVDSGATKTYLQLKHEKILQNAELLRNGPYATLSDNSKIQATVKFTLPLHPNLAPMAFVYPNLNNESLLSIGQLCGNACITIFDKSKLSILKMEK